MEWTQVASGRMQRSADSLEKFYAAAAKIGAPLGQEHLAFSFGVQVQFFHAKPEDALKRAWTSMRYQHPKLAAVLEHDIIIYQPVSAEGISAWLADTFITKPGVTAAELFPSLGLPSPMAMMYYLPASSEIVFSTSYWRMDGIGSLLFLSSFLTRLAEPSSLPAWGSEVVNLAPGLDQALSLPSVLSEAAEYALDVSLMNHAMHLPSISVAASSQAPIPSAIAHREELVLSRFLSTAIIAACRLRKVGLQAAVHAALIASTRMMQAPNDLAEHYSSFCSFGLRTRLPTPYKGLAYAVAGAHTGLPMVLKPSGSFIADAQAIDAFHQTGLKDQDTVKGLQVFHNKLTLALNYWLPKGLPFAADPALRTIGVVDAFVRGSYGIGQQKIDVDGFWLGHAVFASNICVHLWCFRGRITLSAVYNTGVYDDDRVKEFLSNMKEVMCKELNVKEQ